MQSVHTDPALKTSLLDARTMLNILLDEQGPQQNNLNAAAHNFAGLLFFVSANLCKAQADQCRNRYSKLGGISMKVNCNNPAPR
jgi:hypothetical protein